MAKNSFPVAVALDTERIIATVEHSHASNNLASEPTYSRFMSYHLNCSQQNRICDQDN